jgi:hypothetical protein
VEAVMLYAAALVFGLIMLFTKYWFFGALVIFGALFLGWLEDVT